MYAARKDQDSETRMNDEKQCSAGTIFAYMVIVCIDCQHAIPGFECSSANISFFSIIRAPILVTKTQSASTARGAFSRA